MKKRNIIALLLVTVFLLTACAEQDPNVTVDGYTVNTENNTITDGSNLYSYVFINYGTGTVSTDEFTVIYPNGAEYSLIQEHKNGTTTSREETRGDYDDFRYISGPELVHCAREAETMLKPQKTSPVNWPVLVLGIVCIAMGVLGLIFPEQTWYITHFLRRWQYQNLDPTEEGLAVAKIGDCILILVGIAAILQLL